ncbi:MAG: type II toxin-antitoxin system RelE/ParE family toxin [Bacteroidales bacterium]|jgi:phage-related protein|nr:type II toxin-antitoxin system RelE/ParE family toxin [Bacteroidales bacterium]MBR3713719.1 type II toxin-antitoxin system RelE/ParE family toxin [Bacteroidales bacterium]
MEQEKTVFEMVFSEEANDFLNQQPIKVQDKIMYNIRKIQKGEKDSELFKKLEGTEIWEFRTLYNNIAYRLFAFWDTETNTLVIATHGIIKKTQKTPTKEIAKAEKIRKMYFEQKRKKK